MSTERTERSTKDFNTQQGRANNRTHQQASEETVFNISSDKSWTVVNVIGADDLGYRGIHEVENHLDGIDRRGQWQVIHKPTEDVVGSIIRDTSKFSEMDTREFHRELQDEFVDAFGQTDVIRYSMDGNTVKAQRITYLSKEKSVEGESWEGIRVTSGPGNLDAWLAVAPQDKHQITTKEAEPFLEKIAEDTGIKPHWWDDNAGDLTVGDYPNALDREIIDV